MWRTSEPVETFAGSFSLVLAYGLDEIISRLEFCYKNEDEDENDHIPDEIERFANMTREQKAWTIHLLAFALLDPSIPVAPLTAYAEATVATIFRMVESMVEAEIYFIEHESDDGWYKVRRAILAVHEKAGRNSPDFIGDDEPLKVECADMEEWKEAVHYIEFSILWDTDYLFNFEDEHPEHAAVLRAFFTIDDDYFSAIPDDPKPAVAKKLLREAQKLCDRVIKREEKKLHTGRSVARKNHDKSPNRLF